MQTIRERFFAKVSKTATCWLWTACKNQGGYGSFTRSKGVTTLAHRLSWELHNGPIPAGLDVLHTCDVRDCVNPAHLFVGTAKDNMQDAAKKGRHKSKTSPESIPRGANHYATKLSPEIAADIRTRCVKRGMQRQLAREYGLSEATVSLVVNGKRWT